ncbi:unnamed protein product, partial [Discosporangium mesarthrocarpum]
MSEQPEELGDHVQASRLDRSKPQNLERQQPGKNELSSPTLPSVFRGDNAIAVPGCPSPVYNNAPPLHRVRSPPDMLSEGARVGGHPSFRDGTYGSLGVSQRLEDTSGTSGAALQDNRLPAIQVLGVFPANLSSPHPAADPPPVTTLLGQLTASSGGGGSHHSATPSSVASEQSMAGQVSAEVMGATTPEACMPLGGGETALSSTRHFRSILPPDIPTTTTRALYSCGGTGAPWLAAGAARVSTGAGARAGVGVGARAGGGFREDYVEVTG